MIIYPQAAYYVQSGDIENRLIIIILEQCLDSTRFCMGSTCKSLSWTCLDLQRKGRREISTQITTPKYPLLLFECVLSSQNEIGVTLKSWRTNPADVACVQYTTALTCFRKLVIVFCMSTTKSWKSFSKGSVLCCEVRVTFTRFSVAFSAGLECKKTHPKVQHNFIIA